MTPPKDFRSLLVINFLSGPGAGKSATAAALYADLKRRGVNCELVFEEAKEHIWDEDDTTLSNQVFITTSQFHKLYQLVGKVDVAVTDTSLLLGRVRSKPWVPEEFYPYVYKLYSLFTNVNFWVNRSDNYEQAGRVHNHEQAIAADKDLRQMLSDLSVSYIEIEAGDHLRSLDHVMAMLGYVAGVR